MGNVVIGRGEDGPGWREVGDRPVEGLGQVGAFSAEYCAGLESLTWGFSNLHQQFSWCRLEKPH